MVWMNRNYEVSREDAGRRNSKLLAFTVGGSLGWSMPTHDISDCSKLEPRNDWQREVNTRECSRIKGQLVG